MSKPKGITLLLAAAFSAKTVKDYFRSSDDSLGTCVVSDYIAQLAAIGAKSDPQLSDGILAALNIMWLADRGFIPNNEFNGPQFVLAQE
jgi:hypothetical protein